MEIVVQKFGGTSVAGVDKLKQVASVVVRAKSRNKRAVVVLSAMAGVTNELLSLAGEACKSAVRRELDVLLATGEQKTAALLSIILNDMGFKAQSVLFHQSGLITNSSYGTARIVEVKAGNIHDLLLNDIVAVVAGFQGCDTDGNITTLGRGGSDLSAVAIAAALDAKVCEIYTDVSGVYTADPNLCPRARKIETISYDEMLNMSNLGAKIMQNRSIELAKKYGIKIHVRSSSHKNEEGTMIISESFSDDCATESHVVSSVTCDLNQASITLHKVPRKADVTSSIFTPIAKEGIIVDVVVQNSWDDSHIDLTFTVPRVDYDKAMNIERRVVEDIGAVDISGNREIAQISVVGSGMRTSYGIISKMLQSLDKERIKVFVISTSEIRISCLVEEKYAELAVRTLHSAFDLDSESFL